MDKKRSLATIVIVTVIGALVALAGSQGGWSIGPLPGFALAVGVAYLVQWIVYIPAVIAQTDRYFDATGAATYISVTVMLLALSPQVSAYGLLLGGLVIVWAARLGSFLYLRNRRSGRDDRFDEIKVNPLRFLSVWTLQGLWVSLTASAAWISIASAAEVAFGWTTWLGLAMWLVGFGFEAVADEQKRRFAADRANAGRFITTGLWSLSRHPNYFGEILLWLGVLVIAVPALHGWQWVALLSPVFVTLLLTRVSGIPTLDAKAMKKWGDDAEYLAYRSRTPALVPRLGRRG